MRTSIILKRVESEVEKKIKMDDFNFAQYIFAQV